MINISKVKTEQPPKKVKKKGSCFSCNSANVVGFVSNDTAYRKCLDCNQDWAIGGSYSLTNRDKHERDEMHREHNFNSKDRTIQFGDSEIDMDEAFRIEETIERNKAIMFGGRF